MVWKVRAAARKGVGVGVRRGVRRGVGFGVAMGVALGVAALAASGSSADDLDAERSGALEASTPMSSPNGDALPENEPVDAVAPEPPEAAASRPIIRFEHANPRVVRGGLIERRMGTRGSYRQRIRHHGVYSSYHATPDLSGRIRYSGASRGRIARYDANRHRRVRIDGVTRGHGRWRVQGIWESYTGREQGSVRPASSIRHHWMGGYREDSRFGVAVY